MRKTWVALALVHILILFWLFDRGAWLISVSGKPIIHDFLDLWAAAVRAWNGDAALAYDLANHTAFQGELIGREAAELPFPYPPHFLFFLLPFAALPYLAAALSFLAISAALYALALRYIVKDGLTAGAMALSLGGGLSAFMYIQVGFLTSALLVGGLALLPASPLMAGILFGCLTAKPHLGVAVAIGLLLGKEWKAITAAGLTALLLAAASALIFGPSVWPSFISAAQNQSGMLTGGTIALKGQSIFALTYPHFGLVGAVAVHGASAMLAISLLVWIWLRRRSDNVKAAAVIATTLLISPYLYGYDAIILTGAAAFLLKDSEATLEKALIVVACVVPAFSKWAPGLAVPFSAWLMLYLAVRHSETDGKTSTTSMPVTPPKRSSAIPS